MESLDTTILNTAGPRFRSSSRRSASMKAVLASYTLSLAVFIPISGWMGGSLRNTPGLLFSNRSLHAWLAPMRTLRNIHLLVAFRILQGMGGALMVPVGRLTLVRTFPNPT